VFSGNLTSNLNVNNFSITGNAANKGVRFDFNPAQTTTFLEYSAPQGGLTFFGGNSETTNVKFTANVNAGADVDYNILKLQNLSNGSLAETKMVLRACADTGGQELGLFKPSAVSGYSFAPVPSAVSGDAGIYNIGGNLKLYSVDASFNPAYITFQPFFANAASEPFKFNLGTGDLNTLGNINLATGKNVYINGVSISAGGGSSNYSNTNVAAYLTSQSITSYGNTQVASYLVANPQPGTYSNTQVASYLTENPQPGTYSNVQVASYLTTNPPTGTYSNVQVASYVAGNITVGNIAGKTSGFTLGYLEMPQVAAANVTLALTDSGKHFYSTSAAPFTVTIPVNSTVAFPIGTVVSIVNQGTANLTVAKGSATLYLGGNTTSASRTITTYGVATLMKVATDTWFVNGTGVV
jgi:hypothetical protein